MSIETRLKSWSKKTISKTELETLFHTSSDAELYNLVSKAVTGGILSPVKASGTNGNRVYPIYLKYRLITSEDYTEALSEINLLHPALTKTGYLQSNPDLYVKYKEQLRNLNRYLFQAQPSTSMSKKERSFEIFDEEKQLEDSSFCRFLEHLGLTADTLLYYDTPEYCFNDFIPVRNPQMTLLICENKDIWFNIRRRMYEDGADMIFGTHIDGVVYGSGNKVSEARALSEYTRFIGGSDLNYLYWGDIDRAGLNIFMSLVKNNPILNIQLFAPAYEEMLRLAKGRSIPESADHREQYRDYAAIYNLFSDELRNRLVAAIETNKRIPQEIINYELLLKVMR